MILIFMYCYSPKFTKFFPGKEVFLQSGDNELEIRWLVKTFKARFHYERGMKYSLFLFLIFCFV